MVQPDDKLQNTGTPETIRSNILGGEEIRNDNVTRPRTWQQKVSTSSK